RARVVWRNWCKAREVLDQLIGLNRQTTLTDDADILTVVREAPLDVVLGRPSLELVENESGVVAGHEAVVLRIDLNPLPIPYAVPEQHQRGAPAQLFGMLRIGEEVDRLAPPIPLIIPLFRAGEDARLNVCRDSSATRIRQPHSHRGSLRIGYCG